MRIRWENPLRVASGWLCEGRAVMATAAAEVRVATRGDGDRRRGRANGMRASGEDDAACGWWGQAPDGTGAEGCGV